MVYMKTQAGVVFETSHPEYHTDCKKLSVKDGKNAVINQARETLRTMLTPCDTVYCILQSVSKSGMSRKIKLVINNGGKEVKDITYLASVAMQWAMSDGALKVSGCGMDMGFNTVYTLGCYLWPNGTDKPHGTRNGVPDSAGGYALKSSWL